MVRIDVERKASVMGYQGGESKDFMKIVCALPNYVANARGEHLLWPCATNTILTCLYCAPQPLSILLRSIHIPCSAPDLPLTPDQASVKVGAYGSLMGATHTRAAYSVLHPLFILLHTNHMQA